MKAMILAAGEGTRLRPHTLSTPKVLLPIGGTPLIEYTLSWLKSYAISQVAINLYNLGGKIEDYLNGGTRLGMNILYSREKTLLGTAGGVKKMENIFEKTFVVVYGDVLTDFNLDAMVQFHKIKNALATIAIFKVLKPKDFGVVKMNDEGMVLNFVEKPTVNPETENYVNGGIYVLEKRILDYVPSGEFYDFAYDLFPKLLKNSLPIYGYVLKADDYIIDIGTLERYRRANDDVKMGKIKIGK